MTLPISLLVCSTLSVRNLLNFWLVSVGLMLTSATGFAQTPVKQTAPSDVAGWPMASSNAPSAPLVKPNANFVAGAALPRSFGSLGWNTLSPVQRNALKPLAASWANLGDTQKRKWITLSANYPQMSPAEQTKLHERMAQWAALSPRQREQARLNFADAKQISPQKKSEKWQAYQALSTEEKQKLAKSAQPKPPRTALAAQPVASDKISRMPMTKRAGGVAIPKPAASVSRNTLLVKPIRPTLPTPPQPPASTRPIIHGATPQ
jgi:hypothetical protein